MNYIDNIPYIYTDINNDLYSTKTIELETYTMVIDYSKYSIVKTIVNRSPEPAELETTVDTLKKNFF